MRNIQKMGSSKVIPEEKYVPRKHTKRKHSRKQRREDKRNFDYNEDKQSLGKYK